MPREHFQGTDENENGVISKRTLVLPYAGEKGCSIVRSLEKQPKRSLANNVKPNVVFTGTKHSSNFNVKDPVPFTEKHDVIINEFVQLKAVIRTMLVNVLEGYRSV